jgi:ubiquinone/menaquinone biosynthesis C-methylase UbiE
VNEHFERVAEAFSYKAEIYDTFGEGHINLSRMRQKVYRHVLNFLSPGDRILELNAGTGTDAVYFARQGYPVHALDISPGMIARLADKVQNLGLQDQITFQHCSFTELDRVNFRPFNLVFSDFGGLNCIKNLEPVIRHLDQVLAPGGYVSWVIMPPFCPWELALIFNGEFKHATRRLHRQGVMANVEGVEFMTYYFTPRQVLSALGKNFHLVKLEGLSVLTPPADRKNFAIKYPRLYRCMVAIDDQISPLPPFNSWGDFFILTAQYKPV